jgi:hypothetical protein
MIYLCRVLLKLTTVLLKKEYMTKDQNILSGFD